MLKTGCPLLSVLGSGQFGTPWERMHWLKLRMPLSSCCTSAWLGALPPFGSRCWQAFWAAWYREVLTPRSCALGNLAATWPGRGSGKFGTSFERMQREKASSWELTDPPACDEPPELVADGLELHAASRAVTATAVQEHSVRASQRLAYQFHERSPSRV